MSKAVMLSIRPKWVEKIASGEKTIEVRKTKPNLPTPFKAYIYCSQGNDARRLRDSCGKVIGEFICDRIDEYDDDTIFSFRYEDYARWNDFDLDRACIHPEDFQNYANGKWLYGWHISDLLIYDQPRELTEFRRACPNSWYCERCAMYWENNGTCGNESLQIKRPPQSWCYVEAMDNG